jgi:dihydrofolate synthase/folylpolyglutamate synthase
MKHLTSLADANKALEPFWPLHHKKHLNTLDHVREFMDFLGHPEDKLKVIHVAGTSGKTSTAYYAAALLHAAGKKVGLTVSPHVADINERVQLNLKPLSEKRFCEGLEEFLELVKESGIGLSYFEVLYTFALWEFVREQVDYAVVEVGVGGLLDSTNVITRPDKVCVITDIGLDHTHILGGSLREIVHHKAGIIHWHNPVFCYRQDNVIMEGITQVARQQQADLHILDTDEAKNQPDFLPLFQKRNFGLARAAASWVLKRDGNKKLTKPLVELAARTHIPGRMETFKRAGKAVIVDVAHNAQKLEALGQSLQAQYAPGQVAALVSLAAGRDDRLEPAAREMAAMAGHLIVTTFSGPEDGPNHSVGPEILVKALSRHGARSIEIITDPAEALQALLKRPEPMVVVTGSFFLLNHVRPLLRK